MNLVPQLSTENASKLIIEERNQKKRKKEKKKLHLPLPLNLPNASQICQNFAKNTTKSEKCFLVVNVEIKKTLDLSKL